MVQIGVLMVWIQHYCKKQKKTPFITSKMKGVSQLIIQ